jgi:hypothetical protein
MDAYKFICINTYAHLHIYIYIDIFGSDDSEDEYEDKNTVSTNASPVKSSNNGLIESAEPSANGIYVFIYIDI